MQRTGRRRASVDPLPGALAALIAFYLLWPVGELEKSLRHLDKASLISGICKPAPCTLHIDKPTPPPKSKAMSHRNKKAPLIALTKLFQNGATNQALPLRELRRRRYVGGGKRLQTFAVDCIRIAPLLTNIFDEDCLKIAECMDRSNAELETTEPSRASDVQASDDDAARP